MYILYMKKERKICRKHCTLQDYYTHMVWARYVGYLMEMMVQDGTFPIGSYVNI